MLSAKLWLLATASILLLLLVIVDETEARKRQGAGGRPRRLRGGNEQELTEAGWTISECVPRAGTCGRGQKTATLGEETQVFRCRLPCAEGEGQGRQGGGRRGGRRGGDGQAGCKYNRGPWSECDQESNTVSRTLTLKNAGEGCEQEKTITKPCTANRRQGKRSDCRYTKGDWSACDTDSGTISRTLTLKPGSSDECEQTKVTTRKCGRECKYDRKNAAPWSECDSATDKMSRTLNLKKGPSTCEPTKVVTRKCGRRDCRYTRGEWSECNTDSGTISRTLTLKQGSSDECEQTKVTTRKCGGECKYDRKNAAPWSECDSATNKMSRILNLKKGPSTCEPTKVVTRKCGRRAKCRYTKGAWSECDSTTNAKTRSDTLRTDLSQPDDCPATRAITATCKRNQKRTCKYSRGDWGECEDGHRTLTRTLSPRSDAENCEPTQVITRPCTTRKGNAKCFYGKWTKFGECNNGVKTKTREILDGGERCQKKTAKTRPC